MNRMCEIFCILFLLGAVFLIGAYGGGGGGSSPNSGSTQNDLTGQLLPTRWWTDGLGLITV